MNNILLMGIILLLQSFVAFIPYMTRKTENFGVSIPISFYHREDFNKMRKQYTVIMLVALLLLAALLGTLSFVLTITTLYVLFVISVFLYVITAFLVYLPFHRKMKTIKQIENWPAIKKEKMMVDTSFHREKLVVSMWWYLLPAALIGITLLMTYVMYGHIPQQIPTHTDIAGNITYDDKSIGTILFLPGTQVVMLILFLFIHYLIKVTKQQVNAENPEVSKQENKLFRRRWSAFMVATGTLLVSLFLYLQLTYIYPALMKYEDVVIIIFVAVILIGTFILAITTGQGGSRIKVDTPNDDSVMNRDDDVHWKLGQFYFNKQDPAIFIEKRFGVGWTNNWARPISWFMILGIIALAVIPMLLVIFL